MDTCPICLEDFDSESDIKYTQCNHYFHTDCLEKWYEKIKRIECPYCRYTAEFDIGLLNSMEKFLIKLSACRGIIYFENENLKQVVNTNNFPDEFFYKKAIDFIKSDNPSPKTLITHCMDSLTNRGYLKKNEEVDMIYYHQA